MARIRTIKPEFWEDEKISQLPLPCRLFYIGCWNFADDFGVIKNNPALLKSWIFPYDEALRVSEIRKWIDALVDARILVPIIYNRESYCIIRTFRNHQKIDTRYEKSYFPKELVNSIIDEALNDYTETTACSQCDHIVTTTQERRGEERIGKDNISDACEGDEEFERFWNLYDKKTGDKTKIRNKFLKLSKADRAKIFETLPAYVAATPEKRYRKNPETYLNNKSWNDEIITDNGPKQTQTPAFRQPNDLSQFRDSSRYYETVSDF